MALIDDTRTILADLIAFPTVSSESNLALIAYAAERLTDCGASISMALDESGQKANVFATIGPEESGGVMLAGHADVVPADEPDWSSDPFVMRETDGRIYGRGACDMKGFLAAVLAAAPGYAAQTLKRPVHVAFTYDEEVGCLGARRLAADMRQMAFRPSAVIVGEPTGMRIIEGHKGCFEYTTIFTGLEGHGSAPGAGVNAVEYAVRYVARLLELAEELKMRAPVNRHNDPWTTLQVGRMVGGSARNVIAGQCRVEWELRPVSRRDAEFVKAELAAYCADTLLPAMRRISRRADIVTETIGEVAGLEAAGDNEARDILAELVGDPEADVVAFGTEAGLYQSLGMSAVVCGPGLIEQAHTPDEYVAVTQLQACLDMLTGLGRTLVR